MSDECDSAAASIRSRDRLRARHLQPAALLKTSVAYDARVSPVPGVLEAPEANQRATLGQLAAPASIGVAADVAGVPMGEVRHALPDQHRSNPASTSVSGVR
jgi:hypothetical protein